MSPGAWRHQLGHPKDRKKKLAQMFAEVERFICLFDPTANELLAGVYEGCELLRMIYMNSHGYLPDAARLTFGAKILERNKSPNTGSYITAVIGRLAVQRVPVPPVVSVFGELTLDLKLKRYY